MTEEKMIQILMKDRCTEYEAKKHIKNGTSIYDIESWEAALNDENAGVCAMPEEWTVENIKAGKVMDISYVTFDGEDYIIYYVL